MNREMWNINLIEQDTWEKVVKHWRIGFHYQEEILSDWESVYEHIKKHCLQDHYIEFQEDIRFAIWGFRNNLAQERREPNDLRDRRADEIKEHLAVCDKALDALDEMAALDELIEHEISPIINATRNYRAHLKLRIKYKGEKKNRRGPKTKYATDRLIRTLEDRWDKYVGRAAGTAFVDFVERVVKASQYKKSQQKELENIDKLIYNAKRNLPAIIAPLADLEFIHPIDDRGGQPLLLYLRSGYNAIKIYPIGDEFVFLHNRSIVDGDASLAEMFSVDG